MSIIIIHAVQFQLSLPICFEPESELIVSGGGRVHLVGGANQSTEECFNDKGSQVLWSAQDGWVVLNTSKELVRGRRGKGGQGMGQSLRDFMKLKRNKEIG